MVRTINCSSLLYPYLCVQCLLLFYYLFQNIIYIFFRKTFIDCENCCFSNTYFHLWVQWAPHQCSFTIRFSVEWLFATIVFHGDFSSLVCSPFLLSFNSIEYCIHFDCPLLTRGVCWCFLSNLINYFLKIWKNGKWLEFIYVSHRGLVFIIVWIMIRSFQQRSVLSLDMFCISRWYIFQNYLENLKFRNELWRFIAVNFAQLDRKFRHLLGCFVFINRSINSPKFVIRQWSIKWYDS